MHYGKTMRGRWNWRRAETFFFFNREGKKTRNNNFRRTLLVCTCPWFGQFGHFSWTIKSNSQKRHWDFKDLIPLSSQRAEINAYYGTVLGTWSFLVNAAHGKKRTTVNLLMRFPVAVSLNLVTQFERILERTESQSWNRAEVPTSWKLCISQGLCYEMVNRLPLSPHPLQPHKKDHFAVRAVQTLGCCLNLAGGSKIPARAC